MARFIVRRLFAMVAVLFAISVLTFLIFQAIPNGDPAVRLGGRTSTPETRAAVRTAAEALSRAGFEVVSFRPEGLEEARQLWWKLFGTAGGMERANHALELADGAGWDRISSSNSCSLFSSSCVFCRAAFHRASNAAATSR